MIIKKIIAKIENTSLKFSFGLMTLLSIISIRLLIDTLLFNAGQNNIFFIFQRCMHELLFFVLTYILFLGILSRAWCLSLKKTAILLIWGYPLIIIPPFIDYLVFQGDSSLWSFYEFANLAGLWEGFLTFFGKDPSIGIVYGARSITFLTLIAIFVITYLKLSQRLKRTTKIFISLGWTLVSYLVFFFLYTFPSWIIIAQKSFSKNIFTVNDLDMAQMFFAPTHILSTNINNIGIAFNTRINLIYLLMLTTAIIWFLWQNYPKKLIAFLKNVRPPQLFYHLVILLTGIDLGLIFADKNNTETIINLQTNWQYYFDFFGKLAVLVTLLSVAFAWLSSVVVNDIFDQKIDSISNPNRPLILRKFSSTEYRALGVFLFTLSIFFAVVVNLKIAFLLLSYHALSWIYSAWPLRLKRFPFISTFISSIAILLVLFIGFILVSPTQNLLELPSAIIWLFIIGFTLSLPVKDLRDIAGDSEDDVRTIPVIFGEYWGKLIIGSGIFISYLASVILLHEFKLFWWSILFGCLSFWIISLSTKQGKINYRNILWLILILASIYGIITVKLVFL